MSKKEKLVVEHFVVIDVKQLDDLILENSKLKQQLEEKDKDKTQLAIQELEKAKNGIKHFCNIHSDEYYGVKAEVKGIELDVCESIDYQIKALKGNNDEPRQSN